MMIREKIPESLNNYRIYIQSCNGEPFYVGMTSQPGKRAFNTSGNNHNEDYKKFIDGQLPSLLTTRISIHSYSKEEAAKHEWETIRKLRLQGYNLMNIQPVDEPAKFTALQVKGARVYIHARFTRPIKWTNKELDKLGRNLRRMVESLILKDIRKALSEASCH